MSDFDLKNIGGAVDISLYEEEAFMRSFFGKEYSPQPKSFKDNLKNLYPQKEFEDTVDSFYPRNYNGILGLRKPDAEALTKQTFEIRDTSNDLGVKALTPVDEKYRQDHYAPVFEFKKLHNLSAKDFFSGFYLKLKYMPETDYPYYKIYISISDGLSQYMAGNNPPFYAHIRFYKYFKKNGILIDFNKGLNVPYNKQLAQKGFEEIRKTKSSQCVWFTKSISKKFGDFKDFPLTYFNENQFYFITKKSIFIPFEG